MTDNRREDPASGAGPEFAPLIPTGVPGLDEVLGGGIQRGSLVIIAGPPGGGKTILAHHIAFTVARTGLRTTVLTAFSEPTNKLILHMRPFAFFDQDLLGQTLDVLSVQQFLRQGLATAADEIVGTVRAARAELVVLDGFRGVRETAEHPEEARRFIYDVSNRLSLLGITLLLTSEANVRDVTFFPEATTADVLLGLAFDTIDARARRALEVLKIRGTAPLSGRHALTISDDGVTIYPRIEARIARLAGVDRPRTAAHPSSAAEGNGRNEVEVGLVSTGVHGLDLLVGGGLLPGTSTLVVGERGAGKTLFALQFALQGVRSGEQGLFVSFRETTDQLLRKTEPFQWHEELQGALDRGTLTVLRTPPVELSADVLADNLLALLDETRARRLVVDEVGQIEHALAASGYAQRFPSFLAALIEALRVRNVTSVLTRQAVARQRATLEHGLGPLATLPENLLWLRQASRRTHTVRSLAIMQTALSGRSDAWHRVTIQAPDGIAVVPQEDDPQEPHRAQGAEGRESGESGTRGNAPRSPRMRVEEGRYDDA